MTRNKSHMTCFTFTSCQTSFSFVSDADKYHGGVSGWCRSSVITAGTLLRSAAGRICRTELQDGAAGPLERRRARWSAPGLRVEMIGCGGRPARRPWGEEVFFKPLFILKSQIFYRVHPGFHEQLLQGFHPQSCNP